MVFETLQVKNDTQSVGYGVSQRFVCLPTHGSGTCAQSVLTEV